MSCRFGPANHSQMLSAPLSVFAMQSLSVVHNAWAVVAKVGEPVPA